MAENQKKEKQNGQKENHTCLPVPDSQRLPNADIAAASSAATGGRRRARASTALVTSRTMTPSQPGRRQCVTVQFKLLRGQHPVPAMPVPAGFVFESAGFGVPIAGVLKLRLIT